jgi:hypothetical protein
MYTDINFLDALKQKYGHDYIKKITTQNGTFKKNKTPY